MKKCLSVVLDISPFLLGELSNKNRTGIYQVAKNILIQLKAREDVELLFYCKPQFFSLYGNLNKLLNISDGDIRTINWTNFKYKVSKMRNYIYKLKISSKADGKMIRWFIWAVLVEILDKTVLNPVLRIKFLEEVDIFLSVYEQLPDNVLRNENVFSALYIHDVTMLLHPELYPNVKKNPIVRIVKTMNNKQLYFANSENTKKDFLQIRPDVEADRIIVAYPGCSSDFKYANIKNDNDVRKKYDINKDKYAFALTSIAPNKNLLRIVRSFLLFVKQYNIEDICLVLGGGLDGEYGSKLIEKMKCLEGYETYIKYIGYVDDEDLSVLYGNAYWFVYTSQYEGFGTPPLEAMSCGCPVIVSNSSSLPEVVGDTGIQIPWNSDEAHVEAYSMYYSDERLRKNNAIKGKERSAIITWERAVDTIVEAINQEQCKRT